MSTPEDRELDALLSRSGRVHAAWRDASVEEPPAALDEAIRAAARRAVRAGPRPAGGSFVTRWRVPMSIAAVLVVSATLTLLLSDRGEHLPGADLRRSPAALEAPSAADAPARDAAKAADTDERLHSAPGVADAARTRKQESTPIAEVSGSGAKRDEANAFGGMPLTKERAPRQPEAFPASKDTKPAQQQDMPAQQQGMPARQQDIPVQQQEVPAQPQPKLAQQQTEPAQQERARAERHDAQAPAAPQPEAVAEFDARTKAQTQAGALDDRAVPSESPVVAANAPPAASEATANQAVRAAPAAAAPIPARPVAQAAEATTKREAPRADAVVMLEPKAWIERILALQRESKVPEAQRSLREFRRRYPDYPLPPELAALLKVPVPD